MEIPDRNYWYGAVGSYFNVLENHAGYTTKKQMIHKKFYLLMLSATAALLGVEMLLTWKSNVFTQSVISIGTIILCAIFFITFLISIRKIEHDNPHRFVNGVMMGTFFKLMACIAALALWLFGFHIKPNKADIFFLMFVYMIFAVIEAVYLAKLSKKKF